MISSRGYDKPTSSAQLARMITSTPMATMSELTRHNLELWGRMQETMLAAFSPPPTPTPKPSGPDPNGTDAPEEDEP